MTDSGNLDLTLSTLSLGGCPTAMVDSGNLDSTFSTFSLGDFPLASGATINSASIAYKLLGPSNAPVIIYPTWFSGLISDNFYLLSPPSPVPAAISSTTHRILIPALFGNGQSTSPSNSQQRPFPAVTVADNVAAQRKLLQHLRIDKIYTVIGWSMGGMTALQWASQFPECFVKDTPGVVAICATAKCSIHNAVFLEGVKSALLGGAAGIGSKGVGTREEVTIEEQRKVAALKSMGRVYAGWGFSQAFYREELFKKLGFNTLEDWFTGFWEKWSLSKDVENLLCMIQTWQTADVSAGADLPRVLAEFKVPALFLPGEQDLYFHPYDAATEASSIPAGESRPIPGVYGHWAGGPGGDPEDIRWIGDRIREVFDTTQKS